MFVTNTIMKEGQLVGYRLQWEDIDQIYDTCKEGLFTKFTVENLINAGYKYYNHNADEVETPDGKLIAELPSIDFSAVDEVSWNASFAQVQSELLSDFEMTKYYTYRAKATIEMKKPTKYEINTREEFINYIHAMNELEDKQTWGVDNRPINAIVNPNALFTIDEVIESDDVRNYLKLLKKRHSFRDYAAYKNLINWLISEGALTNPEPTRIEFLKAYYAWGPDGINAHVTDIRVKLNADGEFSSPDDTLSLIYGSSPDSAISEELARLMSNRNRVIGIADSNLKVHSLHKTRDFAPCQSYMDETRANLVMSNEEDFIAFKRKDFNGFKYSILRDLHESNVSDRLYIDMMSADGHTYYYKADVSNVNIALKQANASRTIYVSGGNFEFSLLIHGIKVPMKYVENEDDYIIWSTVYLKVLGLFKDNTIDPPVSCYAESMSSEGLNVVGAINYAAGFVKNSKLDNTSGYHLGSKKDITSISDVITSDIPEDILQSYKLKSSDLDNDIFNLINLADIEDLKARRVLMDVGEIGPESEDWDPNYADRALNTMKTKDEQRYSELYAAVHGEPQKPNYDSIDYVTILQLAYDILEKNSVFGYQALGSYFDNIYSPMEVTKALVTLVMKELGYGHSAKDIADFIDGMTDNHILDGDSLFRMRVKGYQGFLIDLAIMRHKRVNGDYNNWIYINRVYNEFSMRPVEERRPYMYEVIRVDNRRYGRKYRDPLINDITRSIEAANYSDESFTENDVEPAIIMSEFGDWSYNKCAMLMADYFAPKIFFYIYSMLKTNRLVTDSEGYAVIQQEVLPGFDPVDIKISPETIRIIDGFDADGYKIFISHYDLVAGEFDATTNSANYYIVNAVLNPWFIHVKHGYTLKAYDLMTNYYDEETLGMLNKNPNFYREHLGKGIVDKTPISKSTVANWYPYVLDFDGNYETMKEAEQYVKMSYRLGEGLYTYDDFYDTSFVHPIYWEPVQYYWARWRAACYEAKVSGTNAVSVPLKQDIFYRYLAGYFFETAPSTEPVYDSNGENALAINSRCDVTTISYIDDNAGYIKSSMWTCRLIDRSDAINELDALIDIVNDGWTPSPMPSIVGRRIIVNKKEHFIYKLTNDQVEMFAAEGVIKKVADNKYFVKCLNGNYILEVNG